MWYDLNLLIKLLGIIFPIILFLFRYYLPAQFEKVFSKKTIEQRQIYIELIHFPSELLMVAVGYTIPKTIEYIQLLADASTPEQGVLINLLFNILFSIIVIGGLPFCIARTKVIEKHYFSDQKPKVWIQSIVTYSICIVAIVIAIFLGV